METKHRFLLNSDNAREQSIDHDIVATDSTIKKIVLNMITEHGEGVDLNCIDTSQVTDMSNLFNGLGFCGDISKWDVSNVANFSGMLKDCDKFNCDISDWDTRSAKDMSKMLMGCRSFDQPIGKWDVGNVESMEYMMCGCHKFNQDLGKWDVKRAALKSSMFRACYAFTGKGLSKWDMRSTKDISYMFAYCDNFCTSLEKWSLASCTSYDCWTIGCSFLSIPKNRPMLNAI